MILKFVVVLDDFETLSFYLGFLKSSRSRIGERGSGGRRESQAAPVDPNLTLFYIGQVNLTSDLLELFVGCVIQVKCGLGWVGIGSDFAISMHNRRLCEK
eukprot:TRINITY_DN5144_c1_g2_i1.p1 TRINITY_DN5144_c1_g2~~TRINITY_DN5144_c1_g2_i1.p1  ORF type:complete len:100 (-),score=8.50 TRINITY_DN5144_c1_g2_i1:550-849(-)